MSYSTNSNDCEASCKRLIKVFNSSKSNLDQVIEYNKCYTQCIKDTSDHKYTSNKNTIQTDYTFERRRLYDRFKGI